MATDRSEFMNKSGINGPQDNKTPTSTEDLLAEANARLEETSARLEEANERTEAVRTVLTALVQSVRPSAFNRSSFQSIVRMHAADVPDEGPRSVRHEVILAEVRRVVASME